jgi:sugar phosphate isomerase/epimerase
VTFAYHNHALEFERFGAKLERPADVLIDEAPWLAMELDTYWVHHSGTDVLSTIGRLKGRLPVVHLKDVATFGWEVTFSPVGEGNLDWKRIVPSFGDAGTEWLVVEQDSCKRDAFDCIESSLRFLQKLGA